jgi:hypothetical protein
MPDRAALITALILDRPMCLDCVAEKAGMTVAEADSAVARIGTGLILRGEADRCLVCGETKLVFSVHRSAP